MAEQSTVLVIGTADTKADEMQYLRDCVRRAGLATMLMDVGVMRGAGFPVEISNKDVAAAAGTTIAGIIATGDENSAMTLMSRGAATIARRLYDEGRIAGMVALGGSMGTDLALDVAMALPLGVPKFVISTIAFSPVIPLERLAPDLMMILWVGGLYGLNSVCRSVLSQAAGAVAGAIASVQPLQKRCPIVGMSSLGKSCLSYMTRLVPALEARGYEVAVFHATGMGGRALDSLAEQGQFAAVLDLATCEVANEAHGGILTAGSGRLEGAGRRGVPQIVAPGASDMIDIATWRPIPVDLQGRECHAHNRLIASVGQTPEERVQTAKLLAAKLAASTGPTAFILPTQGIQAWDRVDQPLHDAGGIRAYNCALRDAMPASVEFVEIDAHICDRAFADKVLEIFDAWVAGGLIVSGVPVDRHGEIQVASN